MSVFAWGFLAVVGIALLAALVYLAVIGVVLGRFVGGLFQEFLGRPKL
jgi:hypothetical protein